MPQHNLRRDPDDAPDPDDEIGVVEHYQQQIARTRRLLGAGDQEPDSHARLERELEQWERLLAAEQRDEHWTAGDGDRPLF